ncbi:MAG TPA: tetraacyldisaccharide 4'-kinase [Candidatus Thermoplasmatota archaeon]
MVILDRRGRGPRLLDDLDLGPAHLAAALLGPLSAAYAGGAAFWRWASRPRVLTPPPLCVAIGNLRVGGTGKTPVVADLAQRWSADGAAVAVVSRGYRGAEGGDEPAWIQERAHVPIVLDPDRSRGVRAAEASGAEVVLLDDALQSRVKAAITLAIVLDRDLRRGPRCLPAGPAREGTRGLRRADALLVRVEGDPWPLTVPQRHRYAARAAALCGGRAYAFCLAPSELVDLEGLPVTARPRMLLVSGLARPRSFELSCERFGIAAAAVLRYDDHWSPQEHHREEIERTARRFGVDTVVCPEKNLERLRRLGLRVTLVGLRSVIRWDQDPLPRLRQMTQ